MSTRYQKVCVGMYLCVYVHFLRSSVAKDAVLAWGRYRLEEVLFPFLSILFSQQQRLEWAPVPPCTLAVISSYEYHYPVIVIGRLVASIVVVLLL